MLYHDFSDYALQSPHRLALVEPNGRHWSRGELQLESERLARGLRQLGLTPGDRLALVLPNCAQFIALAMAANRIGCRFSSWEAEKGTDASADFLQGETPRLVIGHERHGEVARKLASTTGTASESLYAVSTVDGFRPYDDLLANVAGEPRDDSRLRLGIRPGVASHAGAILDPFGIEPEQDNVHYCGLSLANRGARKWVTESLHHGHTVILADQWNPREMLRDIQRYRVTTSYMVPGQFAQLLALPPEVRAAYAISSIRHVICPVASCPQQLSQAMTEWWGVLMHECNGTHYSDYLRVVPPEGLPKSRPPMLH